MFEIVRKQIYRKSIINLCFALSSIAAERFKEQILGGWSLSDGHFLERSNYGYGLAIAGLRLLKGHCQCLYLSVERCLAMGYGELFGGGWGGILLGEHWKQMIRFFRNKSDVNL